MEILKSNSPFITKEKDCYTISSMVVNDSIRVELDMKLIVRGDIYIAGDLFSNVPIKAKKIVVIGNITAEELHADSNIDLKGTTKIANNMVIKGNGYIKKLHIGKKLLCDGAITIGQLSCDGDVLAKVAFRALLDCKIKGRLAVGDWLEFYSTYDVGGGIKVKGVEVKKYSRIVLNKKVYIKIDNRLLGYDSDRIFQEVSDIRNIEAKKKQDYSELIKLLQITTSQ